TSQYATPSAAPVPSSRRSSSILPARPSDSAEPRAWTTPPSLVHSRRASIATDLNVIKEFVEKTTSTPTAGGGKRTETRKSLTDLGRKKRIRDTHKAHVAKEKGKPKGPRRQKGFWGSDDEEDVEGTTVRRRRKRVGGGSGGANGGGSGIELAKSGVGVPHKGPADHDANGGVNGEGGDMDVDCVAVAKSCVEAIKRVDGCVMTIQRYVSPVDGVSLDRRPLTVVGVRFADTGVERFVDGNPNIMKTGRTRLFHLNLNIELAQRHDNPRPEDFKVTPEGLPLYSTFSIYMGPLNYQRDLFKRAMERKKWGERDIQYLLAETYDLDDGVADTWASYVNSSAKVREWVQQGGIEDMLVRKLVEEGKKKKMGAPLPAAGGRRMSIAGGKKPPRASSGIKFHPPQPIMEPTNETGSGTSTAQQPPPPQQSDSTQPTNTRRRRRADPQPAVQRAPPPPPVVPLKPKTPPPPPPPPRPETVLAMIRRFKPDFVA
ncbi:hypothetical protein HK104_004919, partial [Borealophlyctis nickersoniae]